MLNKLIRYTFYHNIYHFYNFKKTLKGLYKRNISGFCNSFCIKPLYFCKVIFEELFKIKKIYTKIHQTHSINDNTKKGKYYSKIVFFT